MKNEAVIFRRIKEAAEHARSYYDKTTHLEKFFTRFELDPHGIMIIITDNENHQINSRTIERLVLWTEIGECQINPIMENVKIAVDMIKLKAKESK